METRAEILELTQAFLAGIQKALGNSLFGIYLYGALAFPEGGATGDIDFHVILTQPPDERQKTELLNLHATLARDYPPLGAELDGFYILLENARQTLPPEHLLFPNLVDNSWALHRAHIRAGRCIILYGPDPLEVYPETTWAELELDLEGELDYVERHLTDYPAYCVLNLCRLMYSFKTHDVVTSKRASAAWADDLFPDWMGLIQAARKSYDRQATPQDQNLLESKIKHFFDFAFETISRFRTQD